MEGVSATQSRAQRRKQQRIETILGEAASAFASHGYDAVRVPDIADAADTAVGSIYSYFGSKEGLYLAVVERALEEDTRFITEALDPSLSPRDQVVAIGEAYVSFYLHRPQHFRTLAFPPRLANGELTDQIANRVADHLERLNGILAEAIRRVAADGIERDIDVERATTFLWAAWNGVIALAWRPDRLGVDEDELRRLLAVGADIVRHGLSPDAHRQ